MELWPEMPGDKRFAVVFLGITEKCRVEFFDSEEAAEQFAVSKNWNHDGPRDLTGPMANVATRDHYAAFRRRDNQRLKEKA